MVKLAVKLVELVVRESISKIILHYLSLKYESIIIMHTDTVQANRIVYTRRSLAIK